MPLPEKPSIKSEWNLITGLKSTLVLALLSPGLLCWLITVALWGTLVQLSAKPTCNSLSMEKSSPWVPLKISENVSCPFLPSLCVKSPNTKSLQKTTKATSAHISTPEPLPMQSNRNLSGRQRVQLSSIAECQEASSPYCDCTVQVHVCGCWSENL